MYKYSVFFLLFGFQCWFLFLVSATVYPVNIKTVRVENYQQYNRLCTVAELRSKVPSLCQQLEADGGECKSNVDVILRNNTVSSAHKRAIAVCYKNNARFMCLTGAGEEKEVLVWKIENNACAPDYLTDQLGPLPMITNDDTGGCSNCFGFLK